MFTITRNLLVLANLFKLFPVMISTTELISETNGSAGLVLASNERTVRNLVEQPAVLNLRKGHPVFSQTPLE